MKNEPHKLVNCHAHTHTHASKKLHKVKTHSDPQTKCGMKRANDTNDASKKKRGKAGAACIIDYEKKKMESAPPD